MIPCKYMCMGALSCFGNTVSEMERRFASESQRNTCFFLGLFWYIFHTFDFDPPEGTARCLLIGVFSMCFIVGVVYWLSIIEMRIDLFHLTRK